MNGHLCVVCSREQYTTAAQHAGAQRGADPKYSGKHLTIKEAIARAHKSQTLENEKLLPFLLN